MFDAIGVSCINAPFVVYIYYGIKKPPCRGLVCTLSTVHFSTLRQFLTNSKLLIWLTTHARQSTRHHSVFCLPLKEQSHKDLLILRMIRHDTQLIDHNHYRSNTLLLRH